MARTARWWVLACLLGAALVWSAASSAAISLVGTRDASLSGPGGSLLTLTVPSGVAQNDLLIAQITVRGGSNVVITAPTGWVLLARDNRSAVVAQAIYYRVATASEPSSYSWAFSLPQRAAGGMAAYRGVNPNQPIDVSAGQTNAASTSVTAPSVNTTVANTELLGFYVSADGGNNFSPPAGMTQYYEAGTGGGSNGLTVAYAGQTRVATGATGTRVATTSLSRESIGRTVALRPAAVLLAEWRFDECEYTGVAGEVRDSAGSYHATARNGLNTASGGIVERRGEFTTFSRYAQTSLPLPSEWSLSVWFQTPFQGTHQYRIVAAVAGGGDLLFLDRSSNYRWGVYTPGAITNGTFQFGSLSPGWHHLVLTGQGSTTRLFIDGTFVESVGRRATGTLTYLGTSFDSVNTSAAQGFSAPLDEMMVYAGMLHATDIATLYANQQAGRNADGSARPTVRCGGATAGGFDAFETATPVGSVSGIIKTKISSNAFNLALVALNTSRTAIETGFSGEVRVELLDASNNSGPLDANGCRSTWTSIRTVAPNPVFAPTDGGRKTVPFSEPNAWTDVRVRVSYPATGTPTAVGCSTDNFAIRPAAFTVPVVTDSNWESAGTARSLNNTAASGGAVHKAGRPFTVAASAINASGGVTSNYTGSPSLRLVSCLLPATGCTPGSLTGSAWAGSGGSVTTNTASYTEVGALSLRLVGLNFASVDAGDSSEAERSIESPVVNVGRFVPDHFELNAGNVPQFRTFNVADAACAATAPSPRRSFTYIGQRFGYVTAPQTFVQAKNASGAITANYRGPLWKLGAPDVVQTFSYTTVPSSTPGLDTGLIRAPLVTSSDNGTGTVTSDGADVLAFVRDLATPQASFNANIVLNVSISDGSEMAVAGNGRILAAAPAVFDGGGSGIGFDAGNLFRYGRLKLANAHGSELLDLPVTVEAQYWNGSVFVPNNADHCTAIDARMVGMSNWLRNLSACETAQGGATLSAGRGQIRLVKPGAGNSGSVDLTLVLGPSGSGTTCVSPLPSSPQAVVPGSLSHLQGRWSGTLYDRNPTARATFGVFRQSDGFIYMRELY